MYHLIKLNRSPLWGSVVTPCAGGSGTFYPRWCWRRHASCFPPPSPATPRPVAGGRGTRGTCTSWRPFGAWRRHLFQWLLSVGQSWPQRWSRAAWCSQKWRMMIFRDKLYLEPWCTQHQFFIHPIFFSQQICVEIESEDNIINVRFLFEILWDIVSLSSFEWYN